MFVRFTTASVAFSVFFLAGIAQAEFKEFTSKEGRFKVQMPGTPKESKQEAAGVKLNNYSVEERNGAYAISYAEMPIPKGETAAQLEQRLDGSEEGMVNNIGAKKTKSTKIKLDGKYPGRYIEADIPSKGGLLRAKIFLVDGRLYQALVVGKKSWVEAADTAKFLDSFSLTK